MKTIHAHAAGGEGIEEIRKGSKYYHIRHRLSDVWVHVPRTAELDAAFAAVNYEPFRYAEQLADAVKE
jgi:hypothetical protein